MSILLNNNGYSNKMWQDALKTVLPEKALFTYPDIEDIHTVREKIEYALVWNHPRGDLVKYPNLKGVLLLGAGTEALDQEPELPNVPIVRLIDPEVIKDMSLYALYWVIHFQRLLDIYSNQQQQHHWQRHETPATQDYTITVLGLGAVGRTVAQRLLDNGYHVIGWDKELQRVDGMRCYDHEKLHQAVDHSHAVINCLPLNRHTKHLIDTEFLSFMPKDSVLINISRGGIINHHDLLKSLDQEHLKATILDVFDQEPLPSDSPLWDHPKVTVTPHISGATYARSAAKVIAKNIARIESGETPFPLYTRHT